MLSKIFKQLGVINYKTTSAAIGLLITTLGVILNAWRTKDFGTIFTQSQTLIPIITGILLGLGLLNAKDNNVSGAGVAAVTVHSDGSKENAAGDIVGKQAPSK